MRLLSTPGVSDDEPFARLSILNGAHNLEDDDVGMENTIESLNDSIVLMCFHVNLIISAYQFTLPVENLVS